MFTLPQFLAAYPTSDACLEVIWLSKERPCRCGNPHYSRVLSRPVYQCVCGHQVSPLASTIFSKSSTDLRLWFLAIYLMSDTKAGISAKQLQRITGVTYKCAWRMMKLIRSGMADDTPLLSGQVEGDETFFKPKPWRNSRLPKDRSNSGEVVVGFVERGGRVKVRHVKGTGTASLQRALQQTVTPGSHLYTDGWSGYKASTKNGYQHTSQIHWDRDFKPGENNFIRHADPATQYIEGFWSQLKRGIYGVYRHCDAKYLQSYCEEYAWRYSYRGMGARERFELLLEQCISV